MRIPLKSTGTSGALTFARRRDSTSNDCQLDINWYSLGGGAHQLAQSNLEPARYFLVQLRGFRQIKLNFCFVVALVQVIEIIALSALEQRLSFAQSQNLVLVCGLFRYICLNYSQNNGLILVRFNLKLLFAMFKQYKLSDKRN